MTGVTGESQGPPADGAGPGRGRAARHAGWLAGVAVAAASAVLAVVAPGSWWGGTFAGGVLAALLAARRVVPAAYRPGWPRSTVLVGGGAALAGGCYAFGVPPLGPRPAIAWTLGIVLLVAAFVPVASMTAIGWGGPLGRHGDAVRRREHEGLTRR